MRVAGFGFRKGAGVESLADALAATGIGGVTHLATVAVKADAPCLSEMARRLGAPVIVVAQDRLGEAQVTTHSDKSEAMYGTGSVSEAAALNAAGPGARLVVARTVSADRMATCAIAERKTP